MSHGGNLRLSDPILTCVQAFVHKHSQIANKIMITFSSLWCNLRLGGLPVDVALKDLVGTRPEPYLLTRPPNSPDQYLIEKLDDRVSAKAIPKKRRCRTSERPSSSIWSPLKMIHARIPMRKSCVRQGTSVTYGHLNGRKGSYMKLCKR